MTNGHYPTRCQTAEGLERKGEGDGEVGGLFAVKLSVFHLGELPCHLVEILPA